MHIQIVYFKAWPQWVRRQLRSFLKISTRYRKEVWNVPHISTATNTRDLHSSRRLLKAQPTYAWRVTAVCDTLMLCIVSPINIAFILSHLPVFYEGFICAFSRHTWQPHKNMPHHCIHHYIVHQISLLIIHLKIIQWKLWCIQTNYTHTLNVWQNFIRRAIQFQATGPVCF